MSLARRIVSLARLGMFLICLKRVVKIFRSLIITHKRIIVDSREILVEEDADQNLSRRV